MNRNTALIERIKSGDVLAKNRMVEENLRLVEKIAGKFSNRGYDREEIVQIGAIGLIKAVDKFDTKYNTCFSTYAYPVIEGEIKRFLRDNGDIKVSRSMKEIAAKGRKIQERLERTLGREPSISEIAQECGCEAEELAEAFSAVIPVRSIYESINDNDSKELSLMDTLADNHTEEEMINRVLVSDILSSLKPRERTIIVLRYFKMKTQKEVSQIIGVSQVQVSRIEKKILDQLRKEMT